MNSDEFSNLNAIIGLVLMIAGLVCAGVVLVLIKDMVKEYLVWRRKFPGHSFLTGRRKP